MTRQVGGSHYNSDYQHWDWAHDTNVPYLIGNTIKYLVRAGRKGSSTEDLEKALSYIKKIHQQAGNKERKVYPIKGISLCDVIAKTNKMVRAYGLCDDITAICLVLVIWKNPNDLKECILLLKDYIARKKNNT